MKTIDLSTLQERSNRDLGDLTAPSCDPVYVEHRKALLEAASGTKQIAEFGREKFHSQFFRMQDLNVESLCRRGSKHLEPEQILSTIWRALPNSPFKRFQEAFSEPRNYIVPHFCITQEGRVVFGKDAMEICKSVAPCIVAPHLVPDTLVEELGLAKFSTKERRSPTARFFRKAQRDIRQGLKARWQCCTPLGSRDFRVVVLERPTPEKAKILENLYPQAAPMPSRGLHGSVIISRAANETSPATPDGKPYLIQPTRARALIVSLFSSGFSAYRKTLNQRAGYDDEVSEITEATAALERVGERITDEWRKGVSEQVRNAILTELKEAAINALDLLERDVDPKKIAAKQRFAHSQLGRDSLNRLNPRSTAANLYLGVEQLSRRLKEVARKGGFNETDRTLLATALGKQTSAIEGCVKSHSKIPTLRHNETRTGSAKTTVLSLLKANNSQFEGVNVKPLSTFAGLIRMYGLQQTDAIQASKSDSLPHTRVRFFGLISDAAMSVERLKTLVATNADGVRMSLLQKQLAGLQRASEQLEKVGGTAEEGIVEEIATLASTIEEQLAGYAKVIKSDAKSIVWLERFRKTLRSLDFEERALALHDSYDAVKKTETKN
jgi:hypothetical protein